jgi:branched-chain amino acid transport system substrate-binding protein
MTIGVGSAHQGGFVRNRRLTIAATLFAAVALLSTACAQDGDDDPGASPQAAADCTADALDAQALKLPSSPKDAKDFKLAKSVTKPRILGQAKPTVKLGFIGDLTGGNASLITSSHKSAQLAVKKANEDPELPVELELFTIDNKDSGEDPAPTSGLVKRFVDDPAVVGVVGPGFSGETEVGAPILDEAGITMITPSATNPELTKKGWKTFFRGLATDDVQGGQTGPLIVDVLGCENIAVVDDKSPYGAGIADAVVKSVEAAGGNVVVDEGIEPTTDYGAVIDTVIAEEHDVLYYGGYEAQAPLVLKQYRDKGGEGIFMGGDGVKGTAFLKEGGEDAEDSILTCPCLDPNTSEEPAAKEFAAAYKEEYDGEEAGIYSSESWDATNIFIAAIKDAGADVTRESVLEYVTNLEDYDGVAKTINWTEQHEVVEGDITYVYGVEDGKYTLIGEAAKLAGE